MEVPSSESINLHILGLLITQFRYRPLYQLSQAVKALKKIVILRHGSDALETSIFYKLSSDNKKFPHSSPFDNLTCTFGIMAT